LGAGWYVPEHDAFGIAFPDPPELVARYREAVQIIDAMLREEVTSFDGSYYHLTDAPSRPLPVQRPRPPLTLGAHRRHMLRIVAEYADRWNSHGTPAEIAQRNAILDEHCMAIGRDPASITRSLYVWAALAPADPWSSVGAFEEMVGMYAESGIREFIVDAPSPEQFPVLEKIASRILAP
jgi:alkanesulfonate monooxygenase SsuD/methylene tetrahydromethanopterin reductase-like flavin-dependent oxidoreductase (luciferase family)